MESGGQGIEDKGREWRKGTRTDDKGWRRMTGADDGDENGGQRTTGAEDRGWVTESGVEDRGRKTVAEDRRRGFGQKIYERHLRYRKFHDGLAIPETLLKSVCLAKTVFL